MAWRVLFLVSLLTWSPACGDDSGPAGPYDSIDIDETIDADGLDGPVDIVRDRFGVPHIYATTVNDVAFGQGYVIASDRLPQMDLFRHFAAGTVAELFGALEQEQIDTDLEMRMHRMRPLAQETWDSISSSSDPGDQEMAAFLNRFSDGVNHYLQQLRDGERTMDTSVSVWFDPGRTEPWTPVDCLAIGRLQAWNLSYSDAAIRETETYELAKQRFDDADPGTNPERAARTGAFFDLYAFQPMDTTATVDDFPSAQARDRGNAQRPRVPLSLLAKVRKTLEPKKVGRFVMRDPRNGSNNWVVGPQHAGGDVLLANDPHLQLSSPSIFYLNHLTVPGELDITGITFPGIPGVILGHNDHVAWGATTANHDVSDFYLETVVPCATGGGDCVVFDGGQVAIETWDETIKVGALGTIVDEFTATYERVPHHGPIIPEIADHDLVPRTAAQAISVRYTGHQATNELRAFYRMWRAKSVDEAMTAFESFEFGAQNFVLIDDQGNIGWTTHALLPKRSDGCFTFDQTTNPGGVAPWFVLPGDGSCEWQGFFASENIPHAVNPSKGYLVTANADPIGSIGDGDPLNQPTVEGHLLYVGSRDYAQGYRAGRITRRIQSLIASGSPLTGGDMESVQSDTFSNYGDAMTPHIVAAVAKLTEEVASPGSHPSISDYASVLSPTDVGRLEAASARLASWTFETTAVPTGAGQIADSSATVIFNAWATYFIRNSVGDEASLMGRGVGSDTANAAFRLFERSDQLVTGISVDTGEALLCDSLDTPEVESCTYMALFSLAQALAWAGSEFNSTDMDEWWWGDLHRLTLEALVPADELNVPPPGEPAPNAGGYPRPGDNFSVDASSPGFGDRFFEYGHGPAMRHVTTWTPGGAPRTRIALPGGQINDRNSGHFRDLMDDYWSINQYFELPWSTDEIIEQAESRWRLR